MGFFKVLRMFLSELSLLSPAPAAHNKPHPVLPFCPRLAWKGKMDNRGTLPRVRKIVKRSPKSGMGWQNIKKLKINFFISNFKALRL